MLNGVLGTIIFHMLIVILFLGFKIGEVKKKHTETLQIEFLNEQTNIEEMLAKMKETPPAIQQLDAKTAKNIAVNVADKLDKEISTDKYLDELKNELGIKDLNQQHSRDLPNDNSPEFVEKEKEDKNHEVMNKNKFKGKTRIVVDLDNRDIRKQDVPVYRCEAGGVIVINIVVDQMGRVVNAEYSGNSDSKDECLIEEAIRYSYNFLFTADLNGEPRQKGTITYEFVPQ